ncbi:MAG: hypothetical protein ACK4M9_12140 [Anaerobacillus sp.]|uniref:hypothetical protein n=1 Tax=Anaerobacillus sp. TaxID=1872506 RepID=UPI00391DA82A
MENNYSPLSKSINEKNTICEKYQDYLKIIYLFGNKVMLLKQLRELGSELALFKSPSMFQRQMEELLENDIIKYAPFFLSDRVTQHKVIVLKKYALRYLKGETEPGGSQKVAPVPPLKTNERILLSIFKGSFILQKVIPLLRRTNNTVTLNLILEEIHSNSMSILIEKNKGLDFAKRYWNEFHDFLDGEVVCEQIERLEESTQKRKKGLEYGSKSFNGKGIASISESGMDVEANIKKANRQNKAKSTLFANKKILLDNFTFENMVRSNIQIIRVKKSYTQVQNESNGQISQMPSKLHVTALLFDHLNRQDLYSFTKQIACFYKMLNDMMGKDPNNSANYFELHLTVAIVGYDGVAVENMRRKAEEVVYSPYKGIVEKRLVLTLENWQVDREMQENRLKIRFTDYDISNRYLDGKKFLNLKQNK